MSTDDVLDVAVRAGVDGIEWGSDGHAPPGGGQVLERLGTRCRDVGVEVVSYGSYLGFSTDEGNDDATTQAVLDSAEALGAPMVRIWTELGVGPDSPDDERRRVTERTARYAHVIATRGLIPTLEFHPFTLTHTAASTNELLDEIGVAELRTHWQPDPQLSNEDALDELARIASRLAHLHVFTWGEEGISCRHPLDDGSDLWPAALSLAEQAALPLTGRRFALCEYVRDDDPEQLVADVRTLRRWLDHEDLASQ